jgi:hypothetical protein
MRFVSLIVITLIVVCVALCAASPTWSKDYNSRFIRNYPPGYHGMWYYAERFFDTYRENTNNKEYYAWDTFMSQLTGVRYPFMPAPYAWDYGTYRKFNLPDYNTNNWR